MFSHVNLNQKSIYVNLIQPIQSNPITPNPDQIVRNGGHFSKHSYEQKQRIGGEYVQSVLTAIHIYYCTVPTLRSIVTPFYLLPHFHPSPLILRKHRHMSLTLIKSFNHFLVLDVSISINSFHDSYQCSVLN